VLADKGLVLQFIHASLCKTFLISFHCR